MCEAVASLNRLGGWGACGDWDVGFEGAVVKCRDGEGLYSWRARNAGSLLRQVRDGGIVGVWRSVLSDAMVRVAGALVLRSFSLVGG